MAGTRYSLYPTTWQDYMHFCMPRARAAAFSSKQVNHRKTVTNFAVLIGNKLSRKYAKKMRLRLAVANQFLWPRTDYGGAASLYPTGLGIIVAAFYHRASKNTSNCRTTVQTSNYGKENVAPLNLLTDY